MSVDRERVEELTRELLDACGFDVTSDGLRDTPRRVAAWWADFLDYEDNNTSTGFDVVTIDQLVALTGIRVWSLCEHHLLPFVTTVAVGYITDRTLLGVSKLARIARVHAHTLQVQERLVEQIADHVADTAGTADVAVAARGLHLCMTMRGPEQRAAEMHTHVMRGRFLADPAARAEFLGMVDRHATTPLL